LILGISVCWQAFSAIQKCDDSGLLVRNGSLGMEIELYGNGWFWLQMGYLVILETGYTRNGYWVMGLREWV
jgi:hypothetical protein